MLSGVIFTVFSYILMSFWLTKTSVRIETSQLSFRVFFYLCISSGKLLNFSVCPFLFLFLYSFIMFSVFKSFFCYLNVIFIPPFSWHFICYRATELTSEQYYMFSVTAQTRLGWGKTANALVFTTNNRERPQPPSVPQISPSQVQSEQITFSWTPGRDGFSPLR